MKDRLPAFVFFTFLFVFGFYIRGLARACTARGGVLVEGIGCFRCVKELKP